MTEIVIRNGYRYYYTVLNKRDKKIYDLIVRGVGGFQSQIRIPPTDISRVERIINYIRLDIPEFFYIKTTRMSIIGSYVAMLIYEYRFGHNVVYDILMESENAICDITKRCYRLSDFDKVREIHDYLISVCDYKNIDAPYSHEMPGAILYGCAVCEGISKAFKFIADRVGLNAICVCGELKKNCEQHAWNKVQIDGKYTNVDVTFDRCLSMDEHIRYDYFGICDYDLKDRTENESNVPAYTSYNYYIREHLFASGKSELKIIINSRLQINRWLSFQLPQIDISDEQMMDVLNDIIQQDYKKRILGYEIDLIPNRELLVYSCRIKSKF